MRVGILGAGRLGRTLARLLVDAGHEVRLANSRGPASLAPLVEELGPRASAGDAAELVPFGDVVILAVRWPQLPAAAAALGDVGGAIIVDPTNNRVGPRPEDVIDLGGRGSSEVVAELLPGARVVKAFNHAPIAALATLGARGSGGDAGANVAGERPALFLAGDDAPAKAVVARLVRDLGAEPVDTGALRDGGRLQSTGGGPLAGHGRLLGAAEARAMLAAARDASALAGTPHGQGAVVWNRRR